MPHLRLAHQHLLSILTDKIHKFGQQVIKYRDEKLLQMLRNMPHDYVFLLENLKVERVVAEGICDALLSFPHAVFFSFLQNRVDKAAAAYEAWDRDRRTTGIAAT